MLKKLIIVIIAISIFSNTYAQSLTEFEDERVSFLHSSELSVSFDKGVYYMDSTDFFYDPMIFEFGIFIYLLNDSSSIFSSIQISEDWEYGYIIGILSLRQQNFSRSIDNKLEYNLIYENNYIDILGVFADIRVFQLDSGVYGVVEAYPGELENWVEEYEIIFSSFELKTTE